MNTPIWLASKTPHQEELRNPFWKVYEKKKWTTANYRIARKVSSIKPTHYFPGSCGFNHTLFEQIKVIQCLSVWEEFQSQWDIPFLPIHHSRWSLTVWVWKEKTNAWSLGAVSPIPPTATALLLVLITGEVQPHTSAVTQAGRPWGMAGSAAAWDPASHTPVPIFQPCFHFWSYLLFASPWMAANDSYPDQMAPGFNLTQLNILSFSLLPSPPTPALYLSSK